MALKDRQAGVGAVDKVKPGTKVKPEVKSHGIWGPELYIHMNGAALPAL